MTICSDLESLLSQCEESHLRLYITADGGVRWAVGDRSALPPAPPFLDALRPHKAAIAKLLAADPRPAPDPVVFVARNLSTVNIPAKLAPPVAFHEGDRPFYRLTPRVLFWLENTADAVWNQSPKDDATRAKFEAMAAVLWDLSRWVDAHYRPDQIRRGRKLCKTLPVTSKPTDTQ